MELLIEAVTLHAPQSPWHLKPVNIGLANGAIAYLGTETVQAQRHLRLEGLHASAGWVDMRAHMADPGHEHKEDLQSGLAAAAAGGFTGVLLMPNTQPAVDTKNQVAYLYKQAMGHVTQVFPAAAVTVGAQGQDLSEMIDLHEAGAKAFTDGHQVLHNPDMLLKGLLYLQKFNGLLINRPEEEMLTRFGTMHEGVNSTMLGLKGMPAVAEELMVARDLRLLEYAGGRLHFALLSTAGAVEQVRQAKQKGLKVSASVAIHQLLYTDQHLEGYDTNYKVVPPLRTVQDQEALLQGLEDGTIDAIVTDHRPHDEEAKKLEFDLAEFGIMGLEPFYAHLNRLAQHISLDLLLEKITTGPRALLGLPPVQVQQEAPANLTFFAPQQEWHINSNTVHSKAENTPLWGQKVLGKVLGTVRQGYEYWAPEVAEQVNKD